MKLWWGVLKQHRKGGIKTKERKGTLADDANSEQLIIRFETKKLPLRSQLNPPHVSKWPHNRRGELNQTVREGRDLHPPLRGNFIVTGATGKGLGAHFYKMEELRVDRRLKKNGVNVR